MQLFLDQAFDNRTYALLVGQQFFQIGTADFGPVGIERLHRLVQHIPEHSGIQRFADLVRGLEFLYFREIELGRTAEIVLQGRC